MANITTRWHHFCDAVRDRRVRVFDAAEGGSLPFATDEQIRFDLLASYVQFMTVIPRFVIAEEVMELVRTDQALLSISDMIACNLLRLPFTECVLEFMCNNVSYSVLLTESNFADGGREWEGTVFSYRDKRLNDDAALLFPCIANLKVNLPDNIAYDTSVEAPKYPAFECSVRPDLLYKNSTSSNNNVVEEGASIVLERSVAAFCAAVIFPQTIGLSKTNVETKLSFNKVRVKKGRSLIPKYTYIRFNSDAVGGSLRADGARVAVHLRRAHKRRVAIGEGRTGRVWRFFPPQIVGYLPDGRKPSMPEMLATRGAKPYLLK